MWSGNLFLRLFVYVIKIYNTRKKLDTGKIDKERKKERETSTKNLSEESALLIWPIYTQTQPWMFAGPKLKHPLIKTSHSLNALNHSLDLLQFPTQEITHTDIIILRSKLNLI